MEADKTSVLQPRKPVSDFNLQRMEDIFDRMGSDPDVPHRHDYYTVIVVQQAEGKHVIDYQTYTFGEKEVHFVSPGQVHQVFTPSRPQGWAITFSRTFMVSNDIPERFVSDLNLFRAFGENPPLQLDSETYWHVYRVIREMETVLQVELNYRHHALGALLQLMLIYCNSCKTLDKQQLDEDNAGICMFRSFKDLVEQRYAEWHQVTEYAQVLHVTPKHLSHTVKQVTGKTAKAQIQDRIVLEGKRLLLHTDLPVKQVAYRLGFNEPVHFTSFFKKHTLQSPSDFRS